MIIGTSKILLAILSVGMFLYCVSVFNFSFPLLIFIALAMLLIVSIFYTPVAAFAAYTTRFVCVVSLLAFLLLMLAGTIGGSFHLSESNKVISAMLLGMTFFSFTSFLWPINDENNT